MHPNELKFLNAFNSIHGVGPATLRLLKTRFESYEHAWHTDEGALRQAGLEAHTAQLIGAKRPSLNPNKELEKLVREGIWLITDEDARYPALLKEIPHAPVALYGKGNIPVGEHAPTAPGGRASHAPGGQLAGESSLSIGVVGTRRPTRYGLEVAEAIVRELAEQKVTIASGLAIGIDTKAHTAALQEQGRTIAVLGSGLDESSLFPQENRGLARRIIESGGAVISEYPPGMPAFKEHFPQRNRIISGLAHGVLVVEARERSGALITARFALEQNREVFAIPGSLFSPTAHGPHRLIQEGAKLATSAKDILEEFGIEYNKGGQTSSRGELEEKEKILLALLDEPLTVDAIKMETKMETSAIIASLSMLELKGYVKNLAADTYQRV